MARTNRVIFNILARDIEETARFYEQLRGVECLYTNDMSNPPPGSPGNDIPVPDPMPPIPNPDVDPVPPLPDSPIPEPADPNPLRPEPEILPDPEGEPERRDPNP